MKMADLMVSEGYLAAGYNILSLDDCWLDHKRSASGQLMADPSRFPSGIKALADYVKFAKTGYNFSFKSYLNFLSFFFFNRCIQRACTLGSMKTTAISLAVDIRGSCTIWKRTRKLLPIGEWIMSSWTVAMQILLKWTAV